MTETAAVKPTTRDGRTAVHAVQFSDPVLDAPRYRWTAVPSVSEGAPRCVQVLFLAPAGPVSGDQHEFAEGNHRRHIVSKGRSSRQWSRSAVTGSNVRARVEHAG